jgi:1,4-alpha-glucan branching enzyme
MLYLDYSRKAGEWLPNHYGGRENLEAIDLLREINRRAYFNYPGILMIAEESTAWPGVTYYSDQGGLGFGFKWNLGWMNDTLSYLGRDPIHRKYHHNELTFGFLYAFSEKFILPLSHDEVVHGKGSIIARIPGDEWQKFATVRAYYSFMFGHPGKKLLFMGDEFAQRDEWDHDNSLDWHLLDYEPHQGIQKLVTDLNTIYRSSPSLYEADGEASGFSWVDADNHGDSVFAFLRHTEDRKEQTLVVVNMTPQTHENVRLGVPVEGRYIEILNSDATEYGGSGKGNMGGVNTDEIVSHGYPCSVNIVLPPLATVMFRVKQ